MDLTSLAIRIFSDFIPETTPVYCFAHHCDNILCMAKRTTEVYILHNLKDMSGGLYFT